MNKSVLLIIYEFVPLGDARIIRWSNLSRYLADAGYHVTIVTSEFTTCNRSYDKSLLDIIAHPNIDIQRVLQPNCQSSRVELVSWLRRTYHLVAELFKQKPYQVLLSSALPIFPHLVASVIRRRGLVPLWFADYGDPWSTSRTLGQGKIKKFLEQIIEREALRVADGLIITTPQAQEAFLPIYPHPQKIHVIPNGASYFHLTHPWVSGQRLIFEGDTLQILYTGSFYRTREPNKLFEGLAQAEGVQLNIVGRHRMDVDKIVQMYDVQSQITMQPYTEQRTIVQLQDAADILLLTSWSVPEQISGKIYEYLATNKPILYVSDHQDDLASQILRENDAGQYICEHQPDAIAKMLKTIREDALQGNLPQRIPSQQEGFDKRARQLIELIEHSL